MRAYCSICSDFFDEESSLSVTPCGHVYHTSCVTLWISQAQLCPECRKPTAQTSILKLYMNVSPTTAKTYSDLENDVINVKAQLSAKNIELQGCRKEKEDAVACVRQAERNVIEIQQAAYQAVFERDELCQKIQSLFPLGPQIRFLMDTNKALSNEIQLLSKVQSIVSGTQRDADKMLKEYNGGEDSVKEIATICTVLKQELTKAIKSTNELSAQNTILKKKNCMFIVKLKFYEDAMGLSSKKDIPVADVTKQKLFQVNNSIISSTPATREIKACSSTAVGTSPANNTFNNLKLNICVSSPSASCKANSDARGKETYNIPFSVKRGSCGNSIIQIGCGNLGSHSNFINLSNINTSQEVGSGKGTDSMSGIKRRKK